METDKDKIMEVRRSLRLSTQVLPEKVYCELDEDECMGSDGDLDQEMKQGCVSTDPRRVQVGFPVTTDTEFQNVRDRLTSQVCWMCPIKSERDELFLW